MSIAPTQTEALTREDIRAKVQEFFEAYPCDRQRLLLIVPDNTRSSPIGDVFQEVWDAVSARTAALDVMIALGTHRPLTNAEICTRLCISEQQRDSTYASCKFLNHNWEDPGELRSVGTIPASEIRELSNGLFDENVEVTINRHIFDYDRLLIVGPTFPHEVVGFSGGHKYFYPGIAGPELINFFHWLGAMVTNMEIIGRDWTPPRKIVERAAEFIKIEHHLMALVATGNRLHGFFAGETVQTWEEAAALSAQKHVIYLDQPYKRVIGVAPPMYEELWTAGKAMYKLEPVVADGGELVIYAPHLKEVSLTHGKYIREIGYHVRDYFLANWEKFKHIPLGVVAHSTHVRGVGKMIDGVEHPRVKVTLASQLTPEQCAEINLGWADPASIDMDAERAAGSLVVPKAGEVLHRLKA